jgi:formylglycine-generating enzyme required for sulfatase activity
MRKTVATAGRVAVGLACALALLGATGCGPQPAKKKKAKPSANSVGKVKTEELRLDLGEGVGMTFVRIPSLKIWVGKFEVSNAEYRRFNPKHSSGQHRGRDLDGDDQPVVQVSWDDAQKFIAFLNKTKSRADGRHFVFRLPTEEEWETYATAGVKGTYVWGNTNKPPSTWNYFGEENTDFGQKLMGHNDGFNVTAPVRSSGENAWGLFGTGGNVWEWCEDLYAPGKPARVYRGGSFTDRDALFLQTARRSNNTPDYRHVNLGFRVVAEVTDMTPEEREEWETAEKARIERLEAQKAREAEERARKAEEARAQADQATVERKAQARADIEKLMTQMKYEEAGRALEDYAAAHGRDDFHIRASAAIRNTKVVRLADDVPMEFVWLEDVRLWVGKYEVNNRQYRVFAPQHDSGTFRDHALNGPEQPAVNVSWDEAAKFAEWMTGAFGRGEMVFRLPTESEWESFARCGQSWAFPWGPSMPPAFGNYGLIEDYDDGAVVSAPVSESGANAWGLYGVGGNVWEWCDGWFDASQKTRVFRGAAWNLNKADALRIDNRGSDADRTKSIYVGFRLVMTTK